MKIKWSDEAQQTWDESLEYCVVNYGKHFGEKLLGILTSKTNSLASFPESGSPMAMLNTKEFSYRSITLYKDYKIIYRVDYQNDCIIIIDIVNMRMSYRKMRNLISGK
ncbi:MAG: type II toxin-antitoxin system RelE/ParE family toxin [Bacteroidales bacterium]|nr:type II toxin-antitoxin system RelE/ParE family toxin [Bacteroidales bacterium]